MNHILRQIQTSAELIEEFVIAVRDWGSLEPIGLLTDALASWSPVLRKAHRTCSASRCSLSDPRIFFWIAKGSGKNFHFSFIGVGAVAGVRWMMDVLVQEGEPGPGVEIGCRSTILQDAEAINKLASIKNITIFEAKPDWNENSLQILLQALGNSITPGFLWLTNLKLQDWRWGTESIAKMLQARFSDNGASPIPLPKLTIELLSTTPWWWSQAGNPRVQRQIIEFRAVKWMSALNGVERIHFGSAWGQAGMLGVVWSDEFLGPTWG